MQLFQIQPQQSQIQPQFQPTQQQPGFDMHQSDSNNGFVQPIQVIYRPPIDYKPIAAQQPMSTSQQTDNNNNQTTNSNELIGDLQLYDQGVMYSEWDNVRIILNYKFKTLKVYENSVMKLQVSIHNTETRELGHKYGKNEVFGIFPKQSIHSNQELLLFSTNNIELGKHWIEELNKASN